MDKVYQSIQSQYPASLIQKMKEESASSGLLAWPINSIDELMARAKSTQEQQKQFSRMTIKQRAESEQLQSDLTKIIDGDLGIVRK